MSYIEARSHFEKAELDLSSKGMLDLLDGLKHLFHALEEDFRTLEQGVRNTRDVQSSKQIPGDFKVAPCLHAQIRSLVPTSKHATGTGAIMRLTFGQN